MAGKFESQKNLYLLQIIHVFGNTFKSFKYGGSCLLKVRTYFSTASPQKKSNYFITNQQS